MASESGPVALPKPNLFLPLTCLSQNWAVLRSPAKGFTLGSMETPLGQLKTTQSSGTGWLETTKNQRAHFNRGEGTKASPGPKTRLNLAGIIAKLFPAQVSHVERPGFSMEPRKWLCPAPHKPRLVFTHAEMLFPRPKKKQNKEKAQVLNQRP